MKNMTMKALSYSGVLNLQKVRHHCPDGTSSAEIVVGTLDGKDKSVSLYHILDVIWRLRGKRVRISLTWSEIEE